MTNSVYADKMSVFSKFFESNKDFIMSTAPKNPTITKDDEWYNEDEWDSHYKELVNAEH